jgi:hypothetical protein
MFTWYMIFRQIQYLVPTQFQESIFPLLTCLHGWRKKGIRHRVGGPIYAVRSLPQYISAFAMRVLQSTNVCVKGEGERAWARIFKLFRTPGISSTELVDLFRICSFAGYSSLHYTAGTSTSNDIETKANESFNNGVFFDIKAKQTRSIVRKLFLKQSEHVR